MSQFSEDIAKFNGIYKLPVSPVPTLDVGVPVVDRLRAFKNILGEELDEMDEIVAAVESGTPPMEVLTKLADLLGDIQVYCASEMAKFGLPLDTVLSIIMQSNFSKLGADGQPIYDERGKVMKGPNYWKPEPKIQAALEEQTVVGLFGKIALELSPQIEFDEGRKVFAAAPPDEGRPVIIE